MGGGGLQRQHPVAPADIAAAEDDVAQLLLRAQHAAQRQRAFGREQVAVRPADFGARAFARTIAQLARDRARRRRLHFDADIDRARIGVRDRLHLDGGHEARLDQRALQIVERRGIIRIPGLEARNLLYMVRVEHPIAGQCDDPPEPPRVAGRDGKVERRGLRRMIHHDLRLADVGEGKARLTRLRAQLRRARNDRVGVDRVVRLHPEGLVEHRRLVPRRADAAQCHRGEAIERPRLGREHDLRLGARFDPRRDTRVVIALAAQQRAQQVAVLARTPVELRGIGGAAVILRQRRQFLEPAAQQRRRGAVDPLDPPAIAPLARRIGRLRRGRLGRVGLQLGPGDPDIGQCRERGVGIERHATVGCGRGWWTRRIPRGQGLRRSRSGNKERGSRA